MTENLQQQIQQGCNALKLDLTVDHIEQLAAYVQLLDKWNKVYNLTSVRKPDEMVSRHILDSLTLLPYLTGKTLLDVGSGAGLPGIPIAIVRPDLVISLLDSNSKKTRFLQQVKAELDLINVAVIHSRVEQANLEKFDMVTARAFSTMTDMIDLAGRHCDDAGYLLLMKGVFPQQELQSIGDEFKLQDIVSLDVPNYSAERHLVRLLKNSSIKG